MQGETDSTETRLEVNRVSIKIPPFWSEKPEIWFYQVEAQFTINKISTEETKFNYLVSQLEPKYVENVWDIVKSEHTNKYSLAKDRMLAIFKESEDKRIKRLVIGIELGDLKPSQLLRKMQALAGVDISDKVLRTMWLEKLPDFIKGILIVSDEALEKLAVMADKILEMNPRSELYAASRSSINVKEQKSKDAVTMGDVLNKISALEQQIAALSTGHRTRSRYRSPRNRSLSRHNSRKRYNPKGKYCYFHFRFGNKCEPTKCVQPCSWENQENSNKQ